MTTKKDTADTLIKAAQIGAFITLQKIVPAGALQARRLRNGAVALYWRYTFQGATDRVVIGNLDTKLPPKSLTPKDGAFSVAAAAKAAQDLAQKHADARATGGHRGLIAADKDEKAKAKATRVAASKQTVEAMVIAYCDHLQAIGRSAHRDARSIFNLHLIEAWPALAKTPAAEITDEQVADMLRRLFEMEKGRTANKLRAYLHAAFEVARKAKTDPKVPVSFKAFNVRFNPAAATAANADENKADKNPLNADQMRDYWRIISALPGQKGALLRLHLLTGGQRIEQLVRLKRTDVTDSTIMLFDGKGRPGKAPRPHPLPLTAAAVEALKTIVQVVNAKGKAVGQELTDAPAPAGDYVLSTDGGKTHIAATTLSAWAVEAAATIDGFKTKRLRSGVETLLASSGISKDMRGRLQSHGISGVQAAHYDAHDYMPEKTIALEALLTLLTTKLASNVVTMKAA